MACAAGAVVLSLKYLLEIPGIANHGTPNQKLLVSLGLGLVFLLHPTCIYVVIYVWQRTALMSGLFFFLALAAYLATRTGRIKNAAAGYAMCAVMFFFAIASKENAIAFPAILLLVELAFFNARLPDLLKRSAVGGSVVLIAVLALSFAERPHGNMVNHGGIFGTIARYYVEGGLTLAQVAMGQCVVFFEYLKMVVLPLPSNVHLISGQIVPSSITDPPSTAAAVAGVVGLACFAGVYLLRRRPLVGFGLLFFIITLLPEALLVPQYLFFGYRVFVPIFGLLLIAADGILSLLDLPQNATGRLSVKVGLVSTLAVIVLLMSCATVSKEALWMDPVFFWKDVYDRLPRNDNRVERFARIQALNNLGYHLAMSGKLDQAIALHRRAMQIDRRIAYTYICLGADYFRKGRLDDATAMYRELLSRDKNNANAHAGLAAVLLKQNKLVEALENFKKAEELKPGYPDYNYGIASVLLIKNGYASAMTYLLRTIKSNPNHVEAHYNIEKILMDAGTRTPRRLIVSERPWPSIPHSGWLTTISV
jgi:protein O-mannosyl-transferase